MNNTKVSVVWTDARNPEYYFTPNWAVKLPRYFKKNFEFTFFALTTTNSAIYNENENITVWLKPDNKTLSYGVTKFTEPDVLIVIGTSDFPFEILFGDARKKILIAKGSKTNPKNYNLFNLVITETEEEIKNYKTAVCQPVVDTENYTTQQGERYFSVCYPQDLPNKLQGFFEQVRFYGSVSNNLPTTVKIPLTRHDILKTIFSQSQSVSLLDDFDSFDLAMSALACNTPVVALNSVKASKIPVVYSSSDNPERFIKTQYMASKKKLDWRHEYILPNFTVEKLAGIIKEIL